MAQRDKKSGVHEALWSRKTLDEMRVGARKEGGSQMTQDFVVQAQDSGPRPEVSEKLSKTGGGSTHGLFCVLERLVAQWREGWGGEGRTGGRAEMTEETLECGPQ